MAHDATRQRIGDTAAPKNFIRQIIDADLEANKNDGRVVTRFPPEPNGYLHIGHAKAICLNFGIARDYGGVCRLRFDDTNPAKESVEYMESIKEDVRWVGFEWDELRYASDYFEQLYEFGLELIEKGEAYVCSLKAEEIRAYRGTLTEPGLDSPYRSRTVEENLDLFRRMRAGEFADGAHVLRAKIDMSSPNLNLRDPVIYRIRRLPHYRTGSKWCIYPMYDYTQCLSDAIEHVTHSLCTLEFEDHRPLYDWVLDTVETPCHPQQIEFSRLNLTYTVMSKRMLNALVSEGHVSGWDDPRMPTISGIRRRGYPAAAIREFCERVGITKKDNNIELGLLESCVREELDRAAPRAMCVLRPLRLVIDNYPETTEELGAPNHPSDAAFGSRTIPFSKILYIERDDFMEAPSNRFFRLSPGREVRLRYAYIVRCERVERDPDTDEIVEIGCSYDPATRGGTTPDGRKVKGTIHWVSAAHAVSVEARLYDRLFRSPAPGSEGRNFIEDIDESSLEVLTGCMAEASLENVASGARLQFERLGYFCADTRDSTPGHPVFNRTVTLRDSWAKVRKP